MFWPAAIAANGRSPSDGALFHTEGSGRRARPEMPVALKRWSARPRIHGAHRSEPSPPHHLGDASQTAGRSFQPGMRHQDIGPIDVSAIEKHSELVRNVLGAARTLASITPSHPRAIINACAGGSAQFRLHQNPIKAASAKPCVEDNCRCALACAIQMQAIAADINQLAWCAMIAGVTRRSDCFVARARNR